MEFGSATNPFFGVFSEEGHFLSMGTKQLGQEMQSLTDWNGCAGSKFVEPRLPAIQFPDGSVESRSEELVGE
jgi:hypothetical protein